MFEKLNVGLSSVRGPQSFETSNHAEKKISHWKVGTQTRETFEHYDYD